MALQQARPLSLLDISTEAQLARTAIDLGAAEVGGPLSVGERELVHDASDAPAAPGITVDESRSAILAGRDPLGVALCTIRSSSARRRTGAFYTPMELVRPMATWILSTGPDRVVDVGCGSGRFASEVARRHFDDLIVAVDDDPLATLLTRAVMAVLGHQQVRVIHDDYTTLQLPGIPGRTAFVGNPPYVRHHDLPVEMKERARATARRMGRSFSSLAGLHAYFYLSTAVHARPGDSGCFVTSSEWLDTGYGAVVRELLLGELGGRSLHVLEPTAAPFPDAMTTAAIACFIVGSQSASIRMAFVKDADPFGDFNEGREIPRSSLMRAARWTPLIRGQPGETSENLVLLGDIARVHRGVVTGSNAFFILTRDRAREAGIERWCRPVVTKAQEILSCGGVLRDGPERRLVLDVPGDIDRSAYPELDAYLRLGEQSRGGNRPVSEGYICRHRRPWWRLGIAASPPIIVSYMARQAPAFALNPDGLALINIAHGLYPRRALDSEQLAALANCLNGARDSFRGAGRTYHGGMEKFEPGELEALLVPAAGAGI